MNWEAVHDAISNQDDVELDVLLSSRKRPIWNDYITTNIESGTAPFLHMAASVDDPVKALTMMKILLKSGMDVNVLDADGRTALMAILETGIEGLFDRAVLLLDHGTDLNILDKNNDTSFFVAWRRRHLAAVYGAEHNFVLSSIVERMLDKGINLCTTDSSGRTPLMLICGDDTFVDSRRLKSILERILTRMDETQRSSCLNALDKEGKSVLLHAMDLMKPTDIVLKLLELSANPFVGDPTGSKLFFRLIYGEPKRGCIVDLSAPKEKDKTLEVITKLVELGLDPTVVDHNGGTAFHVLAQSSNYDYLDDEVEQLVELLWKLGVDICATDKLGRTPLMLAYGRPEESNPFELANLFLDRLNPCKRTEYVNATDLQGKSTLWYASHSYAPGVMVLLLLGLSANPFVGDDPTGSELFLDLLDFAFEGRPDRSIPEESLDEDVWFDDEFLIDFFDDYDDPVLWNTVNEENQDDTLEAINTLIDLGCNPKAFEITQRGTPFHILARSQTIDFPEAVLIPLMDSLTSWGVDICTSDLKGRTPLMEVCANRRCHRPVNLLDIFLARVDKNKRIAHINALDNKGRSALIHATKSKQPDVVVLRLLEYSANPFIGVDSTGSYLFLSFLHKAVQDEGWENRIETGQGASHEALSTLLHLGYNFRACNPKGESPLHVMGEAFCFKAEISHLERMARFMVSSGADRWAEDNRGRTPLMLACASIRQEGSVTIDALVVDMEEHLDLRTAYVNKLDNDGKSVFDYAMESQEQDQVVLRLLELSANPFIGDPTGSKVLLRFLREDAPYVDYSTIRKLLDVGSNPNTPDESGRTALHLFVLRLRKRFFDKRILSALLDYGADSTIRDKEGNVALNYAGTSWGADSTFIFTLLQRMVSQGEWNNL